MSEARKRAERLLALTQRSLGIVCGTEIVDSVRFEGVDLAQVARDVIRLEDENAELRRQLAEARTRRDVFNVVLKGWEDSFVESSWDTRDEAEARMAELKDGEEDGRPTHGHRVIVIEQE